MSARVAMSRAEIGDDDRVGVGADVWAPGVSERGERGGRCGAGLGCCRAAVGRARWGEDGPKLGWLGWPFYFF